MESDSDGGYDDPDECLDFLTGLPLKAAPRKKKHAAEDWKSDTGGTEILRLDPNGKVRFTFP